MPYVRKLSAEDIHRLERELGHNDSIVMSRRDAESLIHCFWKLAGDEAEHNEEIHRQIFKKMSLRHDIEALECQRNNLRIAISGLQQ